MSFSSSSRALNIFIAYAIKDTTAFKKLTTQMNLWLSHYPTLTCDHSGLSAGSQIAPSIEACLHKADIIILLISLDFFVSELYHEPEMQRVITHSGAGAARLIPVLLRPTEWNTTPLGQYSPLPSNREPISSWSNRDEALVNVSQGIRQVVEELIHQTTTQIHSTFQHDPPYHLNAFFIDRDTILATISSSFTAAQPRETKVLALYGTGGIGKTQIAQTYSDRSSQVYQHIFWLKASSRTALSKDISTYADRLSLPDAAREDEQLLFATFKQWLHDHTGWLLVLDQVENMALPKLIVPSRSSGHVLLTTRTQATGKHASPILVSSMDTDAGALILLRRAHILPAGASLDEAPTDVAHEARGIAEAMDGFPLALDQAGAYIQETRCSLSTYLALYQVQRAPLLSERGQSADDHRKSVTSTLTLNFKQVQRKDAIALDLLYLLAFVHPAAIPKALLLDGAEELSEPLRTLVTDSLALNRALAELLRFSLIHSNAEGTVLQIHRVVQDVLIEGLTAEHRQHWAQQAVRMVNCVFPAVRSDTWAECERYLPHAQHCATLISRFQLTLKEGALLLERLGTFCSRRASYAGAETYLTQALHLYEHHLSADVLDTAQTLNSLGLLSHQRAHYKEAEAFHQRALELRKHVLGPDDPDDPKIAESLHNLAMIYGDLGQYQQAERIFLHVLAVEERAKGADHPDVADTLNELGLTYLQQGRHAQAEKACRRALAIYEHVRGPDHPDLTYPLDSLGAIAEKRGDYQQAEQYYQRTFTICKDKIGETCPETAYCINKLAGIAASRGDYSRAETLYQQALTISEKTLGTRHPDVALILNNQALLATKQKQYSKAGLLYQRALSIYKLVLGSEHPNVANVLNNQGQLSRETGNEKRAEKLLRHALTIREKVLGTTHSSIAQSLANLAALLADQHQDEEAEPLFQRALAIYGPRHLDAARVREEYASLLERTNRSEEARALRQAIEPLQEDD